MLIIATPDAHAIAVMLLTIFALFLFTKESIPLQTSSLLILSVLSVGFTIFPYKHLEASDFFLGFGHEALVAVCALMIAGQGLIRTGALEPIGRILSHLWLSYPKISLLLTLLIAAILSAFINNVPIVILLLPILTAVAIRTKTSSSDILMPMGFATLIGGMSTTIGTSTNLLVVSIAVDMGVKDFDMFDFFLPVCIASFFAIIYLWLVVPLFLPKRKAPFTDSSPRIFSAKLMIPEDSLYVGKYLEELIAKTDSMMKVSRIHRQNSDEYVIPYTGMILKAKDMLVVEDTPDNLKSFESILGAVLYSPLGPVDENHPLMAEDQVIAEVIISQGSKLYNTTLSRTRFLQRHNLITLALHRSGKKIKTILKDIADIPLQIGDVLLVQGQGSSIAKLKRSREILVLDSTSNLTHKKEAPYAFIIMFFIVSFSALGILPIAISATFGVLMMFLSKCINWKDAGQALNMQVILIVVASLALGKALLETGAAFYLANIFVSFMEGNSPTVILSSLMLLMAILTNVVSNNAAAVIGTPIAVGIAQTLNMPIEPFVLSVLFGANMSYITPMSYKTNLLVMTAGGYKFSDFVKVGLPLTLIMWLSFTFLLPYLYNI